jgi:transcription elongation factor
MRGKEIEGGLKIMSGGTQPMHKEEIDRSGTKNWVGGNLIRVWRGNGRGSENWVEGNLIRAWRGDGRGSENRIRGNSTHA